MGCVASCDEVFGIDENIGMLVDVIDRNDVEMVDNYTRAGRKWVIGVSQITAVVANDHISPCILPFFGAIEHLIEPAVESEGGFTNWVREFQVIEAFLECLELN